MTEDIIDEIVSLAATQIDAALDSGSSHASDMKYLAEFREDLINLLRENKLIQQKYCIFKVRILDIPMGLISIYVKSGSNKVVEQYQCRCKNQDISIQNTWHGS